MIPIMNRHGQTTVHCCVQDLHLDAVFVGIQLMHAEGS